MHRKTEQEVFIAMLRRAKVACDTRRIPGSYLGRDHVPIGTACEVSIPPHRTSREVVVPEHVGQPVEPPVGPRVEFYFDAKGVLLGIRALID